MNDLLKQRINRLLDASNDERGYQILDYLEFLASKYGERSQPDNLFAKITATVENTMRAGKLPVQAITGTMSLMDSAAKVMKGLAAAGQAVVEEAVKVGEKTEKREKTEKTEMTEMTEKAEKTEKREEAKPTAEIRSISP